MSLATRSAEISRSPTGTRSVTTAYSRGTECRTSCVWACGLRMICSEFGKERLRGNLVTELQIDEELARLRDAAAHSVGLHALLGTEPLVLVEVRLKIDLEDHGVVGVSGQRPHPIFRPERAAPQGYQGLKSGRSAVRPRP